SGSRARSGWAKKQIADGIGDPHECPKGFGVGDVADVQFHVWGDRDMHPALSPRHAGNALSVDCGLEMAEQPIERRRHSSRPRGTLPLATCQLAICHITDISGWR